MPRCDALQACRRRVGRPSFFAQYVVGLDEKTGFKSIAPNWHAQGAQFSGVNVAQVRKAFDTEAELMAIATANNAPTPRLLAYNNKTKVIKMEHLGDYSSFEDRKVLPHYHPNLSPQQNKIAGNYLNAVEKLHIAGIVHTDMHTGNVMLHKVTNDVKIIDLNTSIDVRWTPDQLRAKSFRQSSTDGAQALLLEIQTLWDRMDIPWGQNKNNLLRKHIKGIKQAGTLNSRQREDMFRNFYGDFRLMMLDPSTYS